jgi:hypothetical protein
MVYVYQNMGLITKFFNLEHTLSGLRFNETRYGLKTGVI